MDAILRPSRRRVAILLNSRRVQIWHKWLVEQLKKSGHSEIEVFVARGGEPIPRLLNLTFQLEGIVFKTGAQHAAGPAEPGAIAADAGDWATAGSDFDLLIDCTESGEIQAGRAQRILWPLYNDHVSFLAAVEAIIDDAPMRIALFDPMIGRLTHQWGPLAVENYGGIILGLNCVLSRMAELIGHVALGDAIGETSQTFAADLKDARSPPASDANLMRHLVQRLAAKLRRSLDKTSRRKIHWFVGWRDRPDQFDFALETAQSKVFYLLPDDGRRFYADPIPFEIAGRTCVFLEEFPFATEKGVISVAELTADGTLSRPEIVLEASSHLSYPFVFEADGQIWMIPESGNSGRVDLYRAAEFPRRWVLERTILAGINLYDATLYRDAAGYWLFATSRHLASSSMDNLVLYRAPSLAGPWQPHPLNPLLVDARWSRPGGRLIADGDRLLRPTQDCSAFYGGGLSIAEAHVSTTSFRQRIVGRFSIDSPRGLVGCHTYNRNRSIEVIDAGGLIAAPHNCVATYTPVAGPARSAGTFGTELRDTSNQWITAGRHAD